MKLLLISAVVFGLVVCQVKALFDLDGGDLYPTDARRVLPHSRRFQAVQPHSVNNIRRNQGSLPIIDKIFEKIKNFARNVAAMINNMKEPVDKMAYTNLSELLSSLSQALTKFGDNVGSSNALRHAESTLLLN